MCKYTVQFEYGGGGDPITFQMVSNYDLSIKTDSNIDDVVRAIHDYIKSTNRRDGKKCIHDVVLWDENHNGLWGVEIPPMSVVPA